MIWKEILALLIFWFLLHKCCTVFIEPNINRSRSVSIKSGDLRDDDDTIPELVFNSEVDSGDVIFRKNCLACHSFDRDLQGPKLDKNISFKYMERSISDISVLYKEYKHTENLINKWDRKSMRMPKYVDILSPQEISFLKKYIVYKIKNN